MRIKAQVVSLEVTIQELEIIKDALQHSSNDYELSSQMREESKELLTDIIESCL
jgi:hypothetical protein